MLKVLWKTTYRELFQKACKGVYKRMNITSLNNRLFIMQGSDDSLVKGISSHALEILPPLQVLGMYKVAYEKYLELINRPEYPDAYRLDDARQYPDYVAELIQAEDAVDDIHEYLDEQYQLGQIDADGNPTNEQVQAHKVNVAWATDFYKEDGHIRSQVLLPSGTRVVIRYEYPLEEGKTLRELMPLYQDIVDLCKERPELMDSIVSNPKFPNE